MERYTKYKPQPMITTHFQNPSLRASFFGNRLSSRLGDSGENFMVTEM